jgi:hypothetical protein
MSETKKPASELKDSEIESVSGGRWKSVHNTDTDTTDTTDTTTSGQGKNK